jgi:hypothetical protein
MIQKETIKQHLLEEQQHIVTGLRQSIRTLATAADLDEQDTIDPDDLARQNESTELRLIQQKNLSVAEQDLHFLESVTLHPCDTVSVGALVTTTLFTYFVAIPSHPFQYEGHTIVGISKYAPLYLKMKDKKAGDSFTFGNKTYQILSVE